MSVFNTLGIKCIYTSPFYSQGNGRIENIHNCLKQTIAKFTYGSQLEWIMQSLCLPTAITSHNQWITSSEHSILYMVETP